MPETNKSRVVQILETMLGYADTIPSPQSRVEELLIELKDVIEAGGGGGGDLTQILARLSKAESDIGEIKMVDSAQNTAIGELDSDKASKKDVDEDILDLYQTISEVEDRTYPKSEIDTKLTGYVKNTDYASTEDYGIVKLRSSNWGLTMSNDGLYIISATTYEIENETNVVHPIIPTQIRKIMNLYGIASKTTIPEMQSDLDDAICNIAIEKIDVPINLIDGYTLKTIGTAVYKQGDHIFGNIVIECDTPVVKAANAINIGTFTYPPSSQINSYGTCGSTEYILTGIISTIMNRSSGLSVRYDFGDGECKFLKISLHYQCA